MRPLMNLRTPRYCITADRRAKIPPFPARRRKLHSTASREINYALISLSDARRPISFETIGTARERSVRASKDVDIHSEPVSASFPRGKM